MKSLTVRQRAKVNACLSIIHSRSSTINVDDVIGMARTYIASGNTEREAYQQAINNWAKGEPELATTMASITSLIEASDDKTVATYDAGLSAYIETGNEAHIDALAPMMAEDGQAWASNEGLADGDSPFAALAAAYPSSGPQTAIPVSLNAPATAGNTQLGDSANVEGMMSTRTAQRWGEVPVSGVSGGNDPFAGMTPAMAREAARGAAMNNGRAILPTVAPVTPATF